MLAKTVLDEDFMLSATVLIETEWVLRSSYGMSRGRRARALSMLLDLPRLVAVPPHARWAIERMEAGGDFADMIHIGEAEGATGFATLDSDLPRSAGPGAPVPIETLA